MFKFLINTFLIEILFAFNKESRKYYKIDDNNTRHMRIDTEILVVTYRYVIFVKVTLI